MSRHCRVARGRVVQSFSPGPEQAPDDATGSASPSTPAPLPPDSSSDDEMGRTPLQSVDTNSKRGRKRKAADGADGKRNLKKKKAESTVDDDAPSPLPKKTKGTTGGRKRATAPSAPAEVMLTEEGRASLINSVERVAALQHLNNVDDLAKLREQKELKAAELRVSTMAAMTLQLKLDYAQLIASLQTANPALAQQVVESADAFPERLTGAFNAMATAVDKIASLDNPTTLQLRLDADRERNTVLRNVAAALANPATSGTVIGIMQEDRKAADKSLDLQLQQATSQLFDSRERWSKTVNSQLVKVQPALVNLSSLHWRMMTIFVDTLREKFPDVTQAYEDEAASLR